MKPSEPILSAHNLCICLHDRRLIHGVSFEIPKNQITAIIGPSGAGKSTILKTINQMILEEPELHVSGDVFFKNKKITSYFNSLEELRQQVATVFQKPTVFPCSIAENIIFGLKHTGKLNKERKGQIIESCLKKAGLYEEVNSRLQEPAVNLSIGQKQRLVLARAIAMDPDVILLDEPTSALDIRSTQIIEEQITNLKQTKTIILVTHDLEQAKNIADNIICLVAVDKNKSLYTENNCPKAGDIQPHFTALKRDCQEIKDVPSAQVFNYFEKLSAATH